jgi:uncharacterized protein (TIGR03437 family)
MAALNRLVVRWAGVSLLGAALWAQTTPRIVEVGSNPTGVAVDPVTGNGVVGNAGEGTVSILDLARGTVLATVQNVPSPAGIAVNNLGLAVVANRFNNTVTLIDVPARAVRGAIEVGNGPVAVGINTASNIAVVANSLGNSITLVNLATRQVIGTVVGIPTPSGLQAVAVDPELNIAAIASSSANSLFLVDLAQRTIKAQVPVEQSPSGVVIESTRKIAAVTNEASRTLTLIDLVPCNPAVSLDTCNRRTITDVPSPRAISLSPRTFSALVPTGNNGTLEIVNLISGLVESSIPDLPLATGVGASSAGYTVVSLPNSNAVAVLTNLGLFSMVSGASFAPGPFAPGAIVSGFGAGLATSEAVATSVPLPTTLANIRVTVGGQAAPLFYVSAGQINLQIPNLGTGSYLVQVTRSGLRVGAGSIAVAPASPAIFTTNQQGTGQGAILNEDGSTNGPAPVPGTPDPSGSLPAFRGSVIQVFGTGGGLTDPVTAAGQAASSAAPTRLRPTATVDGRAATVMYSGASPGLVGVWQVNVALPADLRIGSDLPLVITLNGISSNTVAVAVR